MTKADSYIRFSDPSQAKGDSYARQHRDAVAYGKANDLELVSDADYTFFDEGISACSGKRRDDKTDLFRFLLRAEDGSIAPGSYLIIESLDRLSRDFPIPPRRPRVQRRCPDAQRRKWTPSASRRGEHPALTKILTSESVVGSTNPQPN